MGDLKPGKGGTFYIPFPCLGMAASDNQKIFLTCGGGGASSSKEVPNVIQAHRFEEATGQLSTIASLSTQKSVAVSLTYSASTGLWLASALGSAKLLQLDEAESTLTEVCTWVTEEEGKEPTQNFAKFSGDGKMIATGGTDGRLKLWKVGEAGEQPILHHSFEKDKEIIDADFNTDSKLIAACDKTGVCRLYETESCKEKCTMTYEIPKTGKLFCRLLRFWTPTSGGPEQLISGANGPRGPACIGIYSLDGKKGPEVTVDSKPMGAFTVDTSGKHIATALTTGTKKVFTLPSLKCIKKTKEVHDLPASSIAFIGEATVVTGSGDRSLHLLPFRAGGGGFCSFINMMCLLMVLLVIVFFMLQIGVKGAALGQGSTSGR